MLDELDFTKEAANQEIFRTFLADNGLDGKVTAPRVYPEASTKRVLTMVRGYFVHFVSFHFIVLFLFVGDLAENHHELCAVRLRAWTSHVWGHAM